MMARTDANQRSHPHDWCAVLSSALRSDHLSHAIVQSDVGPRQMKFTLKSKYLDVVSPFLVNGALPNPAYKATLKIIHSNTVNNCVNLLGPNPILNSLPPPICKTEASLFRHQCATLAQLRSGHCILLEAYKHHIKRAPNALCASLLATPCAIYSLALPCLLPSRASTSGRIRLPLLNSSSIPSLPPGPPPL